MTERKSSLICKQGEIFSANFLKRYNYTFGAHISFYKDTANSGLALGLTVFLHLEIVVAVRSLP